MGAKVGEALGNNGSVKEQQELCFLPHAQKSPSSSYLYLPRETSLGWQTGFAQSEPLDPPRHRQPVKLLLLDGQQ